MELKRIVCGMTVVEIFFILLMSTSPGKCLT